MSWVLSSSRTGARILDKQGDQLSLLESIEYERGRLRNHDIETDRQGRTFNRTNPGRHGLQPPEDPHEHEAKQFAGLLADKLNKARLERRFERLVLVAEPRFLGMLREALDPQTERLVIASVTKDLEQLPVHELAAHLPPLPQQVL